MDLLFLTIKDVEIITNFSYGKAGGIIRGLNAELKRKGIVTHQARVSTEYFAQRHGLTYEYIKKVLEEAATSTSTTKK